MSARAVVLVGPTAAGKTELSVAAVAAAGVPVEIVVLDSRQLYRGIDVATGKPDAAQREAYPHHLLDVLDLRGRPSAQAYRDWSEPVVEAMLRRRVVPLFVGGAGFYLRALREGFFPVHASDEECARVRAEVSALGAEGRRRALQRVDPVTADRLHPRDDYRIGRALEIARLTGEPASELERRFEPRPLCGLDFETLHLSPARAELHARIERRTATWLEGGWEAEIRARLAEGVPADAPGLRTLGYRQLTEALLAGRPATSVQTEIVVATRRYARQQETWFRKESARWRGEASDPGALEVLVAALRDAHGALA